MPLSDQVKDARLEALLKELEDFSTPVDSEASELIDEIFDLTEPASPPPETPVFPSLPLKEEKRRRSYSVVWITSTLLFGLLVGSAVGFFFGKKTGLLDKPIIEHQEQISKQISYWIKELTDLYENKVPPSEIIEPEKPKTEMEKLAPTEKR